ncbi:MAG: hypothetical protein K1X36_10035 [Pyrinomonadaceae bacterium]|nr:hypothetical protein [Pyrinomonadaceae bacterium]
MNFGKVEARSSIFLISTITLKDGLLLVFFFVMVCFRFFDFLGIRNFGRF